MWIQRICRSELAQRIDTRAPTDRAALRQRIDMPLCGVAQTPQADGRLAQDVLGQVHGDLVKLVVEIQVRGCMDLDTSVLYEPTHRARGRQRGEGDQRTSTDIDQLHEQIDDIQ